MGLYLYSPAERPYYSVSKIPKYDWKTTPPKQGEIKSFIRYMRYCINMMKKLVKFSGSSAIKLDREDLVAVLQFHFNSVCTSLEDHLSTVKLPQDNDTIQREFEVEKNKFRTLLIEHSGSDWPDRNEISTWSLSQLFLRVVFLGMDINGQDVSGQQDVSGKDTNDPERSFGMCPNL